MKRVIFIIFGSIVLLVVLLGLTKTVRVVTNTSFKRAVNKEVREIENDLLLSYARKFRSKNDEIGAEKAKTAECEHERRKVSHWLQRESQRAERAAAVNALPDSAPKLEIHERLRAYFSVVRRRAADGEPGVDRLRIDREKYVGDGEPRRWGDHVIELTGKDSILVYDEPSWEAMRPLWQEALELGRSTPLGDSEYIYMGQVSSLEDKAEIKRLWLMAGDIHYTEWISDSVRGYLQMYDDAIRESRSDQDRRSLFLSAMRGLRQALVVVDGRYEVDYSDELRQLQEAVDKVQSMRQGFSLEAYQEIVEGFTRHLEFVNVG